MVIFLYVAFYLFALYAESLQPRIKRYWLMAICLVLAFLAGNRDISWADTEVYVMSFLDYTPTLSDLTQYSQPFGYAEMGFYYIGVVVKTFTSNVAIYFLVVALLSFFFLYKAFDKYCLYPIFGVCAYVSRFYLNRNFVQIRAGLSYAIILMAVQYITKRDWKRFFAWVFVAYLFHHSAIIAVPLYFLCMLDIKKRHIVMGLGMAFVIAAFFSNVVRSMVADNASDLSVDTYVTEDYQRDWGLANPLIYFQTFLLLVYTFTENRMRLTTSHYLTIRNAYFYSTLILITLSCYTTLSGRVSSQFATLEMVIIPSIAYSFLKRDRWIAYLGMGAALTAIFYLNYYGH
jgi:hypothetical protein